MHMKMGGDGHPPPTPGTIEASCLVDGSIPRDTRMLQRSPISNINGMVVTWATSWIPNCANFLSLFCFLPRLDMFPGLVRLVRSLRKTTQHSGDNITIHRVDSAAGILRSQENGLLCTYQDWGAITNLSSHPIFG